MIDDRIYKGKALLYEGIEFNEEVIFYCNDVGTSAIVLEFYKDLKTPYSLEGARVAVNIAKKDGNIVTDFMNITGENKAEYIYPINGLTAVGKSNCTILVYDGNGDRVTFGTFKFRVRADINGDVESTTEYPVLNKLISDVDVLNQDVNSAEALRIVEENHRKSNEVERKNNENDRVKTFNDIKNEYSSIKGIMIDENNAANLQNQINKTNSDLDKITQTSKTLSINLVDYKKYATIVNGKLDWSTAFNKIIEEIKSYENRSLTIKLPSDNLFINSPIVFDGIPSVSLIGDNIYNCRITPSSNITANDFIFTFKPKNVNGSAICGLSISSIWFDMENSECGGIKCSSLNDNVNFTNLHFRNITGNAFKIVAKDKTTQLAYNFVEGVNFDKVTIIGIEKSIRNATKPLIEITSETDDIGGANEIYFYRCKFYCNPTIHDKSLLNSRKAINGDIYTKGWAITECAFVSNVDNDFIQIGSDTQPSDGHRIYSNMFENFHENGEAWASCINLKSGSKNISNAHNFIGYNRFESPYSIKYKYRIFTNNTTVFEPFLKVSEVSIPQGSYGNNIMVFGDTNLANYRNQIFASNGQGYEISSILSVMSRNDSDSNEIKNISPKITLDDFVDGVVKNRLEIKSNNYYYDDPSNSYVDFNQNGVNAFYLYKGCYHVGKRDNAPESIGSGCIYFNNQTKKFMGFNGTTWVELG